MRQVVLHIGTHKTGTTSFQNYLRSNWEEFAHRGVVSYIHPSGVAQCHELVYLALRRELTIPVRIWNPDMTLDEARPVLRAAILDFAARYSTKIQIYSHEGLSFVRHQEEVQVLKNIFAGMMVKVVVVLREKEAFLESWASELRKYGLAQESPFSSSFMNLTKDSWLVDFGQLVHVYQEGFGIENVEVLSYETMLERDHSVIPGLLSACGVAVGDLPEGWDQRLNCR